MGAVPYIPFKSNNKGEGPAAWPTFSLHREEFLRHYHARTTSRRRSRRSNVCSAARSGRSFPVAQKNEALLKCLVYNATCLVHAMYELGIEPAFPGAAGLVPPRPERVLVTVPIPRSSR